MSKVFAIHSFNKRKYLSIEMGKIENTLVVTKCRFKSSLEDSIVFNSREEAETMLEKCKKELGIEDFSVFTYERIPGYEYKEVNIHDVPIKSRNTSFQIGR